MRRSLTLILTCLTAVFSLQSCKQDIESMTQRVPIFRVLAPDGSQSSEIAIDGKAQKVEFTVLATEEWTAEVDNPSYSIDPGTGGVGRIAVTLNATSNETGAVRKAVVSFVCEGAEKQFVYNLTQKEQQPYLSINPKDVTADPDGEGITVTVETNQSSWAYELGDASTWISEASKTENSITFDVAANTSGKTRTADIRFYSVDSPEIMDYLAVTQKIPAVAPTADLLDVQFLADGTAQDVSSMKMAVMNDRRDANISTVYLDKYARYAAKFNNATIARSKLKEGYYYIPYTLDSDFAKKLEDGYAYELVFCSYTDPTATQVKPFSSTQAGGIGMCFRASTGEINFETHVGGSWCELYSGVLPAKQQYYHVVATWDKTNSMALLYVDGVLTASKNTTGDLKFMTTNVDKRWFGIGADPSGDDEGEASFYGEVVIARLYSAPISAEEVKALYKLVK